MWDAVGGFLFLFANMQDKLSKHSSQVELLTELLNLQKDMVIMMLSMLEGTLSASAHKVWKALQPWRNLYAGNVVNGTIGKQMVDTLVESASNVEVSTIYESFLAAQGGQVCLCMATVGIFKFLRESNVF